MTKHNLIIGSKKYHVIQGEDIYVTKLAIQVVDPAFYKGCPFYGTPRKALTFSLARKSTKQLTKLKKAVSNEISVNYHGSTMDIYAKEGVTEDLYFGCMHDDLVQAEQTLDNIIKTHSKGYLIPVTTVIKPGVSRVSEKESFNYLNLGIELILYMNAKR